MTFMKLLLSLSVFILSTGCIVVQPEGDSDNDYNRNRYDDNRNSYENNDNNRKQESKKSSYTNYSLPAVINIQGDSYLRKGTERSSGSGFMYEGTWYERSNSYSKGVEFVESSDTGKKGFWQSSKYWVSPKDANSGSSSGDVAEKPDPSQNLPGIINIEGQTYELKGKGKQSGSGFEFDGHWYARSNDSKNGVEFRATGDTSKRGFWQNSKYWTRD